MQLKKTEIIVIDIETASAFPDFESMNATWQQLWIEKNRFLLNESVHPSELYRQKAGVMAEFGKIICICIGYFRSEDENDMITQLFFGKDEPRLLADFLFAVSKLDKRQIVFAGHNIREFDLPFICRRLLINRIPVPPYLNLQNSKPWDNTIIDTFQYWRFGDYKNYTSLRLLSVILEIPSSKNDIDGSMVGALYWEEDVILQEVNVLRIAAYCKRDVEVTAKIIFRLTGMD